MCTPFLILWYRDEENDVENSFPLGNKGRWTRSHCSMWDMNSWNISTRSFIRSRSILPTWWTQVWWTRLKTGPAGTRDLYRSNPTRSFPDRFVENDLIFIYNFFYNSFKKNKGSIQKRLEYFNADENFLLERFF